MAAAAVVTDQELFQQEHAPSAACEVVGRCRPNSARANYHCVELLSHGKAPCAESTRSYRVPADFPGTVQALPFETMGFQDLNPQEIELVLEKERVIRIAFSAGGEEFLVPVFFVFESGDLCGLTTPGRKTRLAEANPRVAFQVDSTYVTGPWEWASISGQGTFSRVADPKEFGPFAGKLSAKLTDSPEWATTMLQERFANLGMYAWRIKISEVSGRAHGPD